MRGTHSSHSPPRRHRPCRRYDASRVVDLRARGVAVATALQDALGSMDVRALLRPRSRAARLRCVPLHTSAALRVSPAPAHGSAPPTVPPPACCPALCLLCLPAEDRHAQGDGRGGGVCRRVRLRPGGRDGALRGGTHAATAALPPCRAAAAALGLRLGRTCAALHGSSRRRAEQRHAPVDALPLTPSLAAAQEEEQKARTQGQGASTETVRRGRAARAAAAAGPPRQGRHRPCCDAQRPFPAPPAIRASRRCTWRLMQCYASARTSPLSCGPTCWAWQWPLG